MKALRRLRSEPVAVVAAGTLLAAVVVVVGGRALSPFWMGEPLAGGGTTPPPATGASPTSRSSGSASPRPQESTSLSGTLAPQQTLDPTAGASGQAAISGAPFLAVGSEQDNRVFAGSLRDVRDDMDATPPRFSARVMSPVVGAPRTMHALPGLRLVVASTNVAELVLLDEGLTKARSLNVRETVDPSSTGPMRYGSMALDGTTLYVAAAWANSVAAVAIDVQAWRVVRWRILPERYAQFPNVCLTRDGTLAVQTTEYLSLVDPSDLVVRRSIRLGGHPLGLACAGNDIYLSEWLEARVHRVTSTGTVLTPLRYEGEGSTLLYATGDALYVGDGPRVLRCPLPATRCTGSGDVGSHIVSLLRVGDVLFAASDGAGAVMVLDPTSLSVRGTLGIPGGPRGLALLQP